MFADHFKHESNIPFLTAFETNLIFVLAIFFNVKFGSYKNYFVINGIIMKELLFITKCQKKCKVEFSLFSFFFFNKKNPLEIISK